MGNRFHVFQVDFKIFYNIVINAVEARFKKRNALVEILTTARRISLKRLAFIECIRYLSKYNILNRNVLHDIINIGLLLFSNRLCLTC